uniref:G_PROTEIN_RECEP_F1_2 domain-containing protein n=1 Tax=Steinernema glaseri TaxID=37863 RepID=A0A1I7YP68_9BILA
MSGLNSAIPFHERLFQRCFERFHRHMELSECLPALTMVHEFQSNNIYRCLSLENVTVVEHNLDYFTDCSKFEQSISRWIVPLLQLLCFLGNVLNILIYRLPYFDGSSSVHFLRAKALANLIFVLSRIFEVIHAWTTEANAQFEIAYWTTKPYVITVANVSGTISTWLTLLVTMETVMCVLMPFSFRQYCTRRLTLNLLIATVVLSTALHLTFLCTHHVSTTTVLRELNSSTQCWYHSIHFTMQRNTPPIYELYEKMYYWIQMTRNTPPIYELYEKMYYWIQMTVSIVLPTIIMLICSVLIITRFTFKDLGETFSQRRRCVILMTVSTTLSHLFLEGPALLTIGAAALKGAGSSAHNDSICKLNHGNNLLSMVNATIPFFVFLVCNHQFRHMTKVYLQAQTSCQSDKKRALLSQSTVRNRAARDPERSVIEQKLITKVTNM